MSEQTNYLDGPRLYEWLVRYGHLSPGGDHVTVLGQAWARRIYSWKVGGAAYVYTVDRLLTELGVCLGELPDDLYVPDPKMNSQRGKPHSRATRQKALRAYERIGQIAPAAREVGVSPKALRKWVAA